MKRSIHHLTLRVSDIERARHFYENVVGLDLDQHFPGEKVRFRLGAGPGTSRLVLKPPLPGHEETDYRRGGVGLDHVALPVSSRADLEAVEARLAAAGLPSPGIRVMEDGGTFLPVRDPDGLVIELFVDD